MISQATTLTELDEMLKEKGIEVTVTRLDVQTDAHMIGASHYVTIEGVCHGYQKENKPDDNFNAAKGAIGE